MRENILRDLVSRAATDPTFLLQARHDLQGTLARHGYQLTDKESGMSGTTRPQVEWEAVEERWSTPPMGFSGVLQ